MEQVHQNQGAGTYSFAHHERCGGVYAKSGVHGGGDCLDGVCLMCFVRGVLCARCRGGVYCPTIQRQSSVSQLRIRRSLFYNHSAFKRSGMHGVLCENVS
jgi:hypothetical protein